MTDPSHSSEPVVAQWQQTSLADLVNILRSAVTPPHQDRPLIIAIDGRGGAGTSTLAAGLQRHVPNSSVLHTDDLAWHNSFFDWAEDLDRHLLSPLRNGSSVDFTPPAWIERRRAGSIRLQRGLDVVWVEGTGILRRRLAHLIDASMWVQVDQDLALGRLHRRDGTHPAQLQFLRDWTSQEQVFLEREQPWRTATLTIAGTLSAGLSTANVDIATSAPVTNPSVSPAAM